MQLRRLLLVVFTITILTSCTEPPPSERVKTEACEWQSIPPTSTRSETRCRAADADTPSRRDSTTSATAAATKRRDSGATSRAVTDVTSSTFVPLQAVNEWSPEVADAIGDVWQDFKNASGDTRETPRPLDTRNGGAEHGAGSRLGAPSAAVPGASLSPCGGDLPPCYVKQRESGGDYRAVNPGGCSGRSCGGAWQFDPNTWNGYGGYQFAQDAPPEVQDAKARELWNGGAGCGHWAAC